VSVSSKRRPAALGSGLAGLIQAADVHSDGNTSKIMECVCQSQRGSMHTAQRVSCSSAVALLSSSRLPLSSPDVSSEWRGASLPLPLPLLPSWGTASTKIK